MFGRNTHWCVESGELSKGRTFEGWSADRANATLAACTEKHVSSTEAVSFPNRILVAGRVVWERGPRMLLSQRNAVNRKLA